MNVPLLTRPSLTNNVQLLMKKNAPLPMKLYATLPAAAMDMVTPGPQGKLKLLSLFLSFFKATISHFNFFLLIF